MRFLWLLLFLIGIFGNSIAQDFKFNKKSGHYEYVDKNDPPETAIVFDTIVSYGWGLWEVKTDSLWGVFDRESGIVVPVKFDSANIMNSKYTRVLTADGWGLFRNGSELVIETKFQSIDHFEDSIGVVKFNDKWGLYNQGRFVQNSGVVFHNADQPPVLRSCVGEEVNCTEKEMLSIISENITYPDQAINDNVEGRVVIALIISNNGVMFDSYILRSIGGGCDEEALRVVNTYLADGWVPAVKENRNVFYRMVIPVSFKLK